MKHTLQNTWKACASAILALVLSATMAHAQNARGTIVGTLGGEEVSWRVSSDSSGFWYLGEGEAVPSMGGNPWTAPDGVGAIAFSVDLSEGRDQQLVTLEIMSPDGDVLWRADEGGNAALDASYRHETGKLSNVKGDLSLTLDRIDASGNVAERGADPELVIRFEGVLERYGH